MPWGRNVPFGTGFGTCGCRKLRSCPRAWSGVALGPATCAASVGSAVVVGRSRGVVLSFLYWMLRRLLELFVLRLRSEREKEIEILVLGHQLWVLGRQVGRA